MYVKRTLLICLILLLSLSVILEQVNSMKQRAGGRKLVPDIKEGIFQKSFKAPSEEVVPSASLDTK